MTFENGVQLTVKEFDTLDLGNGKTVIKEFVWETQKGMTVHVISYGATITRIKLPDKQGKVKDIVLGYDNMDGYRSSTNPYFGATVGRVANRTGNAKFLLNCQVYNLSKNRGENHLHGGIKGFDKVNWKSYIDGTQVTFSYLSVDGEEGYPGDVITNLVYNIQKDNQIIITMTSKCSAPTPINLTNHSYFNLAGHDTGSKELYNHEFKVNASNYTPLNADLITTGEIKTVENTHFDLRSPKALLELVPSSTPGFDINYCLDVDKSKDLSFIARASHPESGRTLEMYGNQPGVQFYTANFLPEDKNVVIGKDNSSYLKHGAFCFEPQNFPNAVNYANFPNSVLYPGKEYLHKFVYKFGIN
ncbi:galactose mutarotase [Arctopsyche grandis]|uniref:galactose mutarotase n=1 Tax=Arctopsyche grandis TaxID=121162 RepID=UPI00406D9743